MGTFAGYDISVGDPKSAVVMGDSTGTFVVIASTLNSGIVQSALAEHAAKRRNTLHRRLDR